MILARVASAVIVTFWVDLVLIYVHGGRLPWWMAGINGGLILTLMLWRTE
jgi:hypothetical protein